MDATAKHRDVKKRVPALPSKNAGSSLGTARFLSADRPIESKSEDLLGRSPFATTVAEAIMGWDANESLVVLLFGEWGTGKSSVKNMIVETLHSSSDPQLSVLEFNPWNWVGHTPLSDAFFSEMAVALGRSDESAVGRSRTRLWRSYAAYLRLGGVAGDYVAKLMAIVLGLLGVGGVAAGIGLPRQILIVLAGALAAAGLALRASSKVSDAVADAVERSAALAERSLPERKSELAAALSELPGGIVVVMDDVDRLLPTDMVSVFQLVKANGDFPRLVYLLFGDRKAMEAGLQAASLPDPRHFLEKIVQVPFDLPQPAVDRVRDVLGQNLTDLFSDSPSERLFNERRWANLFLGGLAGYFTNLRDVYRFLGPIAFSKAALTTDGLIEVNPIDLIGVEVLRVFEPDVYEALPAAQDALTSPSASTTLLSSSEREARSARILNLVERASSEHREAVREILKQLFPAASSVLGQNGYGDHHVEGFLNEQRVCAPPFFPRYFRLSVRPDELSQSDIATVRSATSNRSDLVAVLERLDERRLLPSILERLQASPEDTDPAQVPATVTALLDVGDSLCKEERSGFGMPHDWLVPAAIYALLDQLPEAERGSVMLTAAQEAQSLFQPVQLISLDQRSHESNDDNDKPVLSEDQLAQGQRTALQRIVEASRSQELLLHPRMLYLLYRWREWGDAEELRSWLRTQLSTGDAAVELLARFHTAVSSAMAGDYVGVVRSRFDASAFSELFPPMEALRAIEMLNVGSLDPSAAALLRRTTEALGKQHEDGGN